MAFLPNYNPLPTGITGTTVPQLLFTQNSNQTVTSTTESTIFGSGIGSRVILGNSLRVGSVIKGYLSGAITTNGITDTLTIKIKYGATNIVNVTSAAITTLIPTQEFKVEFELKIVTLGVSGSCMSTGRFDSQTGINAPVNIGLLSIGAPSTTVTIDTTVNSLVDITFTHNNVTNNGTSINSEVFILN